MSKGFGSILSTLTALFLVVHLVDNAYSQALRVSINIDSKELPRVLITGERIGSTFPKNPRHFSFRNSPGPRIFDVRLFGAERSELRFRKLVDGEYLADGDIRSWQYAIDVTPSKSQTAAAHSSWIAHDSGLLMLDDLLPLGAATKEEVVAVAVQLPEGWKVFSAGGSQLSKGLILTSDYSNDVIVVGKGWREMTASVDGLALIIQVKGKWHFTDDEAAQMAEEIVRRYFGTLGPLAGTQAVVLITGFPNDAKPGNWEAETRGNTVTIVSSDMPFRTQSLQRLHEQLRHELFHLWIPNGVNLSGSYDWFYEGFALYESLKLAVMLNRIRFEDFLDTLSRAHAIDNAQSQRSSLLQMSANRFSGANTQVYARGMLVAFLCDLALLQRSRGKNSVEDLLREVFKRHRKPSAAADGNTAILNLLKANPELVPIVEKYVRGAEKLEWATELAAAGIEDSDGTSNTALRVKEKLNGRQKTLLDKLGYNNWRKLSRTSK